MHGINRSNSLPCTIEHVTMRLKMQGTYTKPPVSMTNRGQESLLKKVRTVTSATWQGSAPKMPQFAY